MKSNLRLYKHFVSKGFLLSLICLILAACSTNDFSDLETKITEIKNRHKSEIDPLPLIKTTAPFSFELDGTRDPFKPVEKEPLVTEDVAPGSLIKPDPNRIKEDLENNPLDSLRMVGTIKKDSTLWALVMSSDNTVYRVSIGNYMGIHDGKIIEISNNEIKLMQIVPDKEPNTWREEAAALKLAEPK